MGVTVHGQLLTGMLCRVLCWVVLTSMIGTGVAGAQVGGASIIGRVTDDTGAVLPGVTVTATSPALQIGQVVAVTDADGDYRINPLPIGTYSVEYLLSGFQTLRQTDIRLSVNFIAKLDQVMKVAALSESINVTGGSPVVDVVSTAVRTELLQETIETLPTSRDGLKVYLNQVPGIRSNLSEGPAGGGDAIRFRVNGQNGQAWDMVEGVFSGRSNNSANSGTHLDFGAVDEVSVQTVASNAEMPRRGIMVNVIAKSGANTFHGGAGFAYENERLQGSNLDDELRSQGIRAAGRIVGNFEPTADFGGRIVRDKLWFFVSASSKDFEQETLDAYYPDGSNILTEFTNKKSAQKLSYQMTPGDRLIAFNHYATDSEFRGASRFVPADSRTQVDWWFYTSKAEWQAVRGSSLVTSLQYGQWSARGEYRGITNSPATLDIATQAVTGASVQDGQDDYWRRRHAKGTLGWFLSDKLGDHDIKGGFDYLYSNLDGGRAERPSGHYQLIFNNSAAFQMNTWNNPIATENRDNYFGLYLQDAWSIRRGLTLNVGFRYEHDAAYAPAQCREAGDFAAAACYDQIDLVAWSSLAPRIHIAYDVSGDGKTAIKGGYGRYNQLREISPEVTGLNANNFATTTWRWADLNGNRDYDSGEVNFAPNGPGFVGTTGGIAVNVVNPNDRQPKADEYSISFERQLMRNLGARVVGVYSRNFNTYRRAFTRRPYESYNIPIMNRDPGPDGARGTADDGGTVTYYDFPTNLSGAAFETGMLINDDNADHTYKTIEVAASKRMANGWQFSFSHSATRSHIPYGNAQPAFAFNPNAEILTANETWEWLTKLSGAYEFPYGIIGSMNYERRSGDPVARQALFTGGTTVPSIVLNVEPIGALRLPTLSIVDIAVKKAFGLPKGHSFRIGVDVFNALNSNTAKGWTLRSGSSFKVPTSIMLPRIAQLVCSYSF